MVCSMGKRGFDKILIVRNRQSRSFPVTCSILICLIPLLIHLLLLTFTSFILLPLLFHCKGTLNTVSRFSHTFLCLRRKGFRNFEKFSISMNESMSHGDRE
jgi:hypothetical protein